MCPKLSGTQLCTYCTIRAGKGVGLRERGQAGGGRVGVAVAGDCDTPKIFAYDIKRCRQILGILASNAP